MPKCWLIKTEPSAYSFGRLVEEGRTTWDGVKNPLALKHLSAVRRGDSIFVYHTGNEKAVVGRARAVSDPYPDPKAKNPRLLVVDVQASEALPQAVTLAAIKANRKLAGFDLARLPRLSVMPVDEVQAAEIEKMAAGST